MTGLTKWFRKHRCMTGLALMLAVMPMMSTGCYGTFPLTKAVYEFNGDAFDNEIANQVLFWAFVIVPVYGFASLGDAVIFNLIEFWTDDTFDITQQTLPDGTEVALVPEENGNARLEVTAQDGEKKVLFFARQDSGEIQVLDAERSLCGYVIQRDNGNLVLQDKYRSTVKVLSARKPLADLATME